VARVLVISLKSVTNKMIIYPLKLVTFEIESILKLNYSSYLRKVLMLSRINPISLNKAFGKLPLLMMSQGSMR